MDALEFIVSALSTKPNFPGSMTGTIGGGGTPGGDWYFISSRLATSFLFCSIAEAMSSTTPAFTGATPNLLWFLFVRAFLKTLLFLLSVKKLFFAVIFFIFFAEEEEEEKEEEEEVDKDDNARAAGER